MKKTGRALSQANDISYELHTLGWKAFQDLCASIAGEIWGQTVQTFLPNNDAGRDGAFSGEWRPIGGEIFKGSFTVQCKFTAKREKTLHLSDLNGEIEKAKVLAERGIAANYILMTNASLTAKSESKIKEAFESITGIKRFAAYGAEWLCRTIRESRRLRMLVPRIYGLGDLSQIMDERAYNQSREILSVLGDDLAKFVITDAHRQSAKALVEHGFVLLLGEPASGKSTIAAALAVGASDVWGCSTVRIRDADDFIKHWNPDEPKQFFWVDDAFGATQFDWLAASAWNRSFSHMQAAIKKGARIVLTSRDYIYRSARQSLKETAFPLLRESQVVIHVERLSKEEKEQILYNHIRLGTQQVKFRREIKPFLTTIAAHDHFLPEIARRLGNLIFTKDLVLVESEIRKFVEKPLDFLKEVIRTLDAPSRAALALVFMRGGNLNSPIKTSQEEQRAIELMGGTLANVRESLNALDGSLGLQVLNAGCYWWRFKHPTVRDAFASLVAEDRELLDIYLTGTPVESLLQEVTCGDVGLEGIKVIVPKDCYGLVIQRLKEFGAKPWSEHSSRNYFLARRCDKEFLCRFLDSNPGFIESLPVWSHLDSISEAPLFVRLHEFGLLPEAERKRFVAEVTELAVDTPDSGFLAPRLRTLFTSEELTQILQTVRDKLLPNLDDVIWSWRSNRFGSKQSVENYFDGLVSELDGFKEELGKDPKAIAQINAALATIKEMVEEMYVKENHNLGDEDFYRRDARSTIGSGGRSVFDDVDE